MTRKALLQRWVGKLDPSVDPAYPAAQLEAAIDSAIAKLPKDPVNHEPECPGLSKNGCPWMADDEHPEISLGQAIANNWGVIRTEAIPTVKAIAANLRS